MPKRKVFVSFDYENDRHYKYLLEAWDANPEFDFVFADQTPGEINNDNVEWFCQRFAAELLLPAEALREEIAGHEATCLPTLVQLCRKYLVPLSALLRRVFCDLELARCVAVVVDPRLSRSLCRRKGVPSILPASGIQVFASPGAGLPDGAVLLRCCGLLVDVCRAGTYRQGSFKVAYEHSRELFAEGMGLSDVPPTGGRLFLFQATAPKQGELPLFRLR